MSQGSEGVSPAAQDLSSLMDGELDASAAAQACRAWRDDPQLRSQWHAYHLIGDVLRSEDLASDASRDAAFLAGLRKRLAEEPVVLAPASTPGAAIDQPAPRRSRRTWRATAAVAAGFAVVAGTLVVTQMSTLPGVPAGAQLATAPAPEARAVVVADRAASATAEPPSVVLNGQIVRDARLDEYLAAHKKFGGSSLPGGPSGFLRNASVEAPAR